MNTHEREIAPNDVVGAEFLAPAVGSVPPASKISLWSTHKCQTLGYQQQTAGARTDCTELGDGQGERSSVNSMDRAPLGSCPAPGTGDPGTTRKGEHLHPAELTSQRVVR